jgi:4-amino-4-deoxy-L-arabinose transferase-like glycosyltransferase
MVCAPYAAWRGASRAVWRVSGIVVASVIVVPWLLAVEHRIPGFLHYAVVTESFERLASDKLRRTEPIWYFLPVLLIGALPWSLALTARIRQIVRGVRNRNPIVVFLVLWIVIPFAFFALSKSKRPQYILPLIPAVGLLVGHLWNESSSDVRTLLRLFTIATMLAGLVFIGAAFALPLFRRIEPVVASNAGDAAIVGVAAMIVAGAAWRVRHRPELAILALALPTLTLPITLRSAMKQVAADHSTRDFAAALNRKVTPRAPIILVQVYRPSLSFYLQRPVLIATADARELTSNYVRLRSRQWIDAPGSPLRSLAWFARARKSLSPESVVVTKTRITHDWRLAEDQFRLISISGSLAAFGPARRASSPTSGR